METIDSARPSHAHDFRPPVDRVRNLHAMMQPSDLPRLFRGPLGESRWESVVRSVPAVLYLGAIHLVSSVPGEQLPSIVDDRVAHFLQYFGLGLLVYLAMSGFDRKGTPWRVVAGVISFCAVWGGLDEWHQSFVPGRDSSLKDLAFDVAGATAAALFVRWIAWRNEAR